MTADPTLFAGGPIRVMADARPEENPPEALLVEAGRVLAVGRANDVRRSAATTPREIDLDGRTLFPGFVDAHAHTLLLGASVDWVNLSDAKTIDDIVDRLRGRAAQRPSGAIRGYGYDQSKLAERRHPSAQDLDAVSNDREVQIQHASGHGYVINTTSLRTHGITADTATPSGGRIDRDAQGRPLGVVFDAACDLLTGASGVKVGNHGPNFHLPMSDAEVARLFELGQDSLLAAGITTMCDAQVTEMEFQAYLVARGEGRLRMRAHLLALSSKLDQLRKLGLVSRLGDERLELHGVKLYADGSVIARTAYLGDHACCGAPSPAGYLYHDPAELQDLITTAHVLGLRTATHAQGEVPIGLVLDAVARAQKAHPHPGLVHRIEHCGFPTPHQVGRMRDLAVVPVPQPMQVHLYGDSLIEEYGDWGASFYPYGSFEAHGVPIVVSSDAPVTSPAPLRAAWAAITRATASGDIAADTQAASRSAAISGVTRTAADLLDRRDVGRLTPGSRADLVLLDADPLSGPVDQLARTQVTETWVGGDVVRTQRGRA